MALEGDLRDFQLPDILQMVALQQKTGILTVQGEQDIIAVSFLRGAVVATDALNQTAEEGLGEILVQRAPGPPGSFAAIAAEHQAGGERLIDLLLMRGALTRPQLLYALRLQTQRLLIQLLRWKEGEFKFYSGEEVSYEEGFDPITVEELLVRAFEELGPALLPEAGGLPTAEAVFEPALPMPAFKVLGRDGEGPEGAGRAHWVSEADARLLAMLDGRTSGRELALRSGTRGVQGPAQPVPGVARRAGPGAGPGGRPAAGAAFTPAPAPARRFRSGSAAGGSGSPRRGAAAGRAVVRAHEVRQEPPPRVRPTAAPRLRMVVRMVTAGFSLALALLLAAHPRTAPLPFPWQEATASSWKRSSGRLWCWPWIGWRGPISCSKAGIRTDSTVSSVWGCCASVPKDPSGRPWEYRAGRSGYSLTPLGADGPVAELAVNEGIPGDFLLDPEFLAFDEATKAAPLVLLD